MRSIIVKYIIVLSLLIVLLTGCNLSNNKLDSENNGKQQIAETTDNPQITGTSTSDERTTQKNVIKNNVMLQSENFGGMSYNDAKSKLESLASTFRKFPTDAKLDTNKWEVQSDIPGKNLDVNKTLNKLLEANEGEKIDPVMADIRANITAAQINEKILKIGEYSTKFNTRQAARTNNIKLACESIDYRKISPGEVFSFNNTLGKRTEEKGYKKAPILLRTKGGGSKEGEGVGGGICQISSTLFNAVEQAGLEITEKHSHSKDVGYVPKGEDATVAYSTIDFKFKNNKAFPIMIRAKLKGHVVTVYILENRYK